MKNWEKVFFIRDKYIYSSRFGMDISSNRCFYLCGVVAQYHNKCIHKTFSKTLKKHQTLRWNKAFWWREYTFLSTISLTCLHDPWWNPSTSYASWKSYQFLTIAEDKPIETVARQRKLTSSTLSFYPNIPYVAFIGSHFSKSLSASSLISHISIFSLLLRLPQFIVLFLSLLPSSFLSLCEYICSKIAFHI